jgi:hypothetical protein
MLLLAGCASSQAEAGSVAPRDYHFSPRGDDTRGDGSAERPFRSLAKVGATRLNPGDRVLLEGGQVFAGNLVLGERFTGTAERPVTIGSYGSGRARIDGGEGTALRLRNVDGVVVENLILEGSGPSRNFGTGLRLTNDRHGWGARRGSFARVQNVEAHGFGLEGIHVEAARGFGFEDVRIEDSETYENGHGGIYISGERPDARSYPHTNVYIGRCVARDNPGDPDAQDENRTGSGILITGVDGAVVERCEARGNGRLCRAEKGGPMGIWASESNRVVIQMCRSTGNRTGGRHDGGGFGLDGGMTNSVMQYNYSSDNDGSGYGLFQYPGARAWHDNTVRYNVSQDDGRRNAHAGIHIWNGDHGLRNAWVYHNTVMMHRPAREELVPPRAIWVQSQTIDLRVMNNVFSVDPGVTVVDVSPGQRGITFAGNCYWASGGGLDIRWAGREFRSLQSWRGTGQERGVGIEADPGLPPNPTATERGATRGTSPLVDSAVNLSVDTGGRDFAGTKLPQGRAADVGAWEAVVALDGAPAGKPAR